MKKFFCGLLVLLTFFSNIGVLPLNAESAVKNSSRITAEKSTVRARKSAEKISFSWHQRNLERHFEKHRVEFPEYKNAQEYGKAAVKFFTAPPPGTQFKRRANGDRLFYYEKENLFGVTTKHGFIKTFFRPNRGKNYWKRQ